MSISVEEYVENAKSWQKELAELRRILLSCGLSESIKWSKPCFMHQNSNVVILYELKDCCAIGFMKGSLLKDSANILLKPGENSQAGRWVKFQSMKEIHGLEEIIRAYVFESIANEEAGLKIEFKKTSEYTLPEELIDTFQKDQTYKEAFDSLTPGRQRGYILHFEQAKQSTTRYSRIEKQRDRILAGKGLQDCVCGLSKRFPRCDGSHSIRD